MGYITAAITFGYNDPSSYPYVARTKILYRLGINAFKTFIDI